MPLAPSILRTSPSIAPPSSSVTAITLRLIHPFLFPTTHHSSNLRMIYTLLSPTWFKHFSLLCKSTFGILAQTVSFSISQHATRCFTVLFLPINHSILMLCLIASNANVNPNRYGLQGMLLLTMQGPENIQVLYLCQLQRLKAPGPLITSVLVATLSMFMSGWALFIFIASRLAEWRHKQVEGVCISLHAFENCWLKKHYISGFLTAFPYV